MEHYIVSILFSMKQKALKTYRIIYWLLSTKCVWNYALLWSVAALPSVFQEESSVTGNDEGKSGPVYESPSKSARSYIQSLERREDGTDTPVFLLQSLDLYVLLLKHSDSLKLLRSCTRRQAESPAALVS